MADFQRQIDIMPPERLVFPLHIIGLGGIGSFVAYTLRKMGFWQFHLWDPDKVESHNLPSQHYTAGQTGESKVFAMREQLITALDTDGLIAVPYDIEFDCLPWKLQGMVVSAVDNMASRQKIWDTIKTAVALVPLFVDGRIGVDWDEEKGMVVGEWIEVFTIVPSRIEDCELYEENLFPDEEAAPMRCTAQAVAYIGPFIGALIASNIKKWIMRQSYYRHMLYNLLTNELVIAT